MPISTAVDASAVARTVGIATKFVDTNVGGVVLMPQHLAIIGQGATGSVYPLDKVQVTSASEAAALFGFGSPLHLAMLQIRPANGDGVGSIPTTIYPLDDDVSGVAATGDITPAGAVTKAGAFRVVISGVQSAQFVVALNDTLPEIVTKATAAIAGVLEMPMTAVDSTTTVDLTSKWKGTSANALTLSIEGPTDTGITFAGTQPSGGLANPSVDAALAQVGNVWVSMVLNCLDMVDSTALDAYNTFGEGRWGALVRKPLVVFTGHAYDTPAEVIAITDTRKQGRTLVALANPGSVTLPFVSAAAQVARIVNVANHKPAWDYGRQAAPYIEPGADGAQWDYPQRDQAVKGGASTIEVRDGVVAVSDTVTMYRPDGEQNPAYRFVKDIVSLQNIIFNVDLIFNTAEWDGAPLIPDDQPTSNAGAKKPKNARSALALLADNLGLLAIISEPEYAKENTLAQIDSQNPNRLNVVFPVKLGGNSNILSIDLNFGFFFGAQTIVN